MAIIFLTTWCQQVLSNFGSSSISKKSTEELSKTPSVLITIFMNLAFLYLDSKLASRFMYFVSFALHCSQGLSRNPQLIQQYIDNRSEQKLEGLGVNCLW